MSIKKRFYSQIEVVDAGVKGLSVGKSEDGRVFMLENCVPGDIVDARVVRKRKSVLFAIPTAFHQYSSQRTEPFCSHFDDCGGCKWQNTEYDFQLSLKLKSVRDSFERIAGLDLTNVKLHPVFPAEKTRFYRNKLDFSFSPQRWLTRKEAESGETVSQSPAVGFHVTGRFDKVLDISKCYLQEEPSNEIRNAVRNYAIEKKYPFYDVLSHTGFLRSLIIRNTSVGEWMVIVVFGRDDSEAITDIMTFIKDSFPQVNSLYQVVNTKKNDTVFDLEHHLYSGKENIIEKAGHLTFEIGPRSFYQTNSHQAEHLYRLASEMLDLKGKEVIYDIYSGLGTIGLYLAKKIKKLISLEVVPEAVALAEENAKRNGVTNATFLCGEAETLLTEAFFNQHGVADLIILDPPRAGLHPKVAKAIAAYNAPQILYISCNPATQARDIAILSENYQLVEMQPVDMFPHTYHIENIALLKRKN